VRVKEFVVERGERVIKMGVMVRGERSEVVGDWLGSDGYVERWE